MSGVRFSVVTHPDNYVLHRFHTDPSGTFVRYDAKAVGSGSEAAQSELQDKWHKVSNKHRSWSICTHVIS